MANSVIVNGSLQISGETGAPGLNRAAVLTQTGTKFLVNVQSVGTAAETLTVADLANIRYLELINPSTNTSTVTVTCSAIVLQPGDVLLGPPSGTLITLQATAAATDLQSAIAEA